MSEPLREARPADRPWQLDVTNDTEGNAIQVAWRRSRDDGDVEQFVADLFGLYCTEFGVTSEDAIRLAHGIQDSLWSACGDIEDAQNNGSLRV